MHDPAGSNFPATEARRSQEHLDMKALRFAPEYKNAFVGYSEPVAARLWRSIDRAGRKLGVEVVGLERLPRGPVLLVANHAFGFWDLAFAAARIWSETGRQVWPLGEHLWWRVPLVRRIAAAMGIVDGTQRNVDVLLQAGKLVLVLPGGLREALKPRELRYRLLWGHHYGFVRAAMRNGAPLVPLACIGGDDLVDLVGDAYARGRRWHLPIPLPRPAHLLSPLRRARLRFVVGEPIWPDDRGDGEAAVRAVRREVEGALHEILEDALARRAGFAPDA